jgi:hypothetical protein
MATDATANQATYTYTWTNDFGRSTQTNSTKVAVPNAVDDLNDPIAYEAMFEIIFQDIGGQELINISRADAINGQNIMYSIVKNLKNIMLEYNSNNIIKLGGTSDVLFKNFSIKLEDKIPKYGNGSNGSIVYLEQGSGNLLIDLVNLEDEEQVEIEIINQGGYFDDTITN